MNGSVIALLWVLLPFGITCKLPLIVVIIMVLPRRGSPNTIVRSPNCYLPTNNLSGELQLYLLEVNLSEPQFAAKCVLLTILYAICHSVMISNDFNTFHEVKE